MFLKLKIPKYLENLSSTLHHSSQNRNIYITLQKNMFIVLPLYDVMDKR
jgi:hypothetical protein